MENMTQEQLIATFGQEVGAQMWSQMQASSGGGNQSPFTFVKKVATHGSELGEFGDFCINVKTEKQPDGTRVITDKGTNLGSSFEFIIVNVSYKYKRWDEVKEKTEQSNMFETLDGIKTAVNVYTGVPLPESKEAKKAKGVEWKLVRINAGLIRKNGRAEWTPVIWETDGKLYFTLGDAVGNQPNGGLMSGVLKLVTVLESKGSTQYPVIDVKASTFGALPKDFFSPEGKTAPMIKDITTKMAEYRSGAQFKAGSAPAATPASSGAPTPGAGADEDETNW